MSKFEKVSMAARNYGLGAAQVAADACGVGLYQSAQWPHCGEVWAMRRGMWVRKLGDVIFCDQPKRA
jgi:hypothetical protein